MKTENTKRKMCACVASMQESIDPETLWLDSSIEVEELVRMDPLEITEAMVRQAEQPELADFVLQSLPERKFDLRLEELLRKQMRLALRKKQSLVSAGA